MLTHQIWTVRNRKPGGTGSFQTNVLGVNYITVLKIQELAVSHHGFDSSEVDLGSSKNFIITRLIGNFDIGNFVTNVIS